MECERPPIGFEALPAPIRPTLSKIVKSIGVRWYLEQTNDVLIFFHKQKCHNFIQFHFGGTFFQGLSGSSITAMVLHGAWVEDKRKFISILVLVLLFLHYYCYFFFTLFLIILYWHCYCYCDIFLTSSFCWANFDNVTLLYFICLKFINVFVFHYIPSEYNIFDIFLTSSFCWANFDMITLLFFSRFISNWVFYISTLSL